MQTGRLNISRGRELVNDERVVPLHRSPERASMPIQGIAENVALQLVPQRLEALERLAALYERGIISIGELEREKALVLAEPVPAVSADPAPPRRRPSLFGRLFRLRVLATGLVVGIAFSVAAQPDETARFADEMARLIGI